MRRLSLSTLLALHTIAAFAGGRTFLVRRVRVFDGSHAIRANSVLVKDGRIAQVGNNLRAEAGTPEIDGNGGTLLPALIDSHVHSYVRPALQQELLFGIATELDMMDPPSFAVPLRKAQAEGRENRIADIFTAGWAATYPGAHGTEGGAKAPTITAPDQAEEFVRARIAEGSDFIKIIYASGGPPRSIDKETMIALVQAAHKFGKMVVAHAITYQAANDAMRAGADGLAHIFADQLPPNGFAKEVARRHMFVIPTLTAIDSISEPNGASLAGDPNLRPYLTQPAVINLNRTGASMHHFEMSLKLQYAQEAVRQLASAGVTILAGSDAPNPGTWYGASLH